MTALLATLPLQVVCQLLVSGHPNITENGTILVPKKSRQALPFTSLRDQGYVEFPDIHTAYKIHEELATWNEARERCMAEGAYLAITDSLEKIAHVKSMRNQSDRWLHVGIYNSADTDQWVRVDDGLPLSSVPWAYDNPNRIGTCAGISILRDGLVDYPCNGKRERFVCEFWIAEDDVEGESSVEVEGTTMIPTRRTLPEGYVAFPEDHAAYKFHNRSVTWDEARMTCIAEGAHLAVTDTVDKIEHVADVLTNYTRDNWMHVGIYRSDIDGKWVRVDNGLAVTSIPWSSVYTPSVPSSGSCTAIIFSERGLTNFHCLGGRFYFACEIPI